VKKRRKKQAIQAPEKETPWSTQFFIGAAIFAGVITLEMIVGGTSGRFGSRYINRSEHAVRYLLPLAFLIAGLAFYSHEKRKK
jgi:putative Mn2+ efflux pump MntP